jgi:putative signal transducing protein
MPLFGPLNVRREGLEVVYRAQGRLEAEAVKGRLETSGIPALLDYESLGQTLGITIDGLGEVRVMVPIDRAEDARLLLRRPIDGEDDEADSEPD